jgi:hypothetical protein
VKVDMDTQPHYDFNAEVSRANKAAMTLSPTLAP